MIENGQVHGSCDGETDTLNNLRRAVLTFLEKKEEYKQTIRQAYGDVAAGTFDFELNKAEGLKGTKTFQVSIFPARDMETPSRRNNGANLRNVQGLFDQSEQCISWPVAEQGSRY